MLIKDIKIKYLSSTAAILAALSLAACTHSAITPEASEPVLPEAWQRGGDAGVVSMNWLQQFDDPQLKPLVDEAIENNYLLEQERARLMQAEQTVVIVRADRWPSVDASVDGTRRGAEDSLGDSIITESFSAGLDARWEVDLWGRLSKAQQAAQLDYAAQQARVESVERDLAVSIVSSVFNVMEARQILEVVQRRLDNARESRDIVATGYRQGLNEALDLYLAENQVERQEAAFAQQEQTIKETIAALQLQLARYPDGDMELREQLPVITDPIPSGLPSELLTRRTDLQEAWLGLLAADADLAAAHKARFPSLSLVGSGGVTTVEFADLLEGDSPFWSITGNLSQPVFQAGRLAALEEQAAARVRQAEQVYLDLMYRAFADVENAISREVSLQERYQSFLEADRNAAAALELALEQYQRGLVPYTTVLESQRQAFDAEVQVVQLRNLLLQNRIALHLSLGGEFTTDF